MTRARARGWRCLLAGSTLAWVVSGCSHDVLPDEGTPSVCGDGVTGTNEGCDVASPGCVHCQVQPGWTCTATGCSRLCIDGGVDAGPSCGASRLDAGCDLSGFWAVRETTYLRDQVFQTVQVSSNWYLYEIAQKDGAFSLAASLDCGVHVTGSATIDYPPATERALIWLNPEDGTDATRGARHGTSTQTARGCAIAIAPWYFVRGATTVYLPANFASDVAIESLSPLPSVTDPVKGDVFPAGATDPTTAGIPGFGTLVSGLVMGLRYAAQRTTTSFATTSDIAPGALTVVMPGTFDVQENVLRVTQCGTGCSLLTSAASPSTDLPPHTTWQFLGSTRASAPVARVVVAAPRQDLDLDVQTCANVQIVLPHDGTPPG